MLSTLFFSEDTDITDSPSILLPPVKVFAEGTSLVKIPCFAEGIPIPDVTWEAVDVKSCFVYLIVYIKQVNLFKFI